MIGRLCEEFHCLPSQAWREWQRVPAGFLETVIEMREFAKVKQAYDANPAGVAGPLADLVRAFDFERAAALIEARRRGR